MKSREIFATRLKEVRLQFEKSQKEFADMVQSTAATISAYENATKNPSLEIVMNIAEKCNISIDWLSGLSDQKELKPEINNYKDFAIKILELLELDVFPYLIYMKKEKKIINLYRVWYCQKVMNYLILWILMLIYAICLITAE